MCARNKKVSMKKVLLCLVLISSIYSLVNAQEHVELKITQSKYQVGNASLALGIVFVNGTSDTVTVIKPHGQRFDINFRMESTQLIGQKGESYRLKITKEGNCVEGDEIERMPMNQPKRRHVESFDLMVIPPNTISNETIVRLEIDDIEFCGEASYFAEVEYAPTFDRLTKKQIKKLAAKHKKAHKAHENLFDYMLEEDMLKYKMKLKDLPSEKILNAQDIIKSLGDLQVKSETVALGRN
jgi:hypothetical protein